LPRRLGQHFLRDEAILERIATAAAPEHEPLIFEIGPGRGALTRHLIPRADRLVAIELDRTLIDPLRVAFPSIEVVESDVLKYAFPAGPCVVAGNLPYYITSPIVEHVLGIGPDLKRAVFLVQKEVAERLAARPGSRDYGYLSVRTQLAARVEMLFPVPPGAFSPPPKVDSAVVELTPLGVEVPRELDRFIGACFLQKRKTLRNNLKAIYPRIAELPEAGLRAEQIPVEGFPALLAALTA
jgi:16S rRNA (adenine1518-N6/adenine1519-N6)-dimethyltransferase